MITQETEAGRHAATPQPLIRPSQHTLMADGPPESYHDGCGTPKDSRGSTEAWRKVLSECLKQRGCTGNSSWVRLLVGGLSLSGALREA